MTYIFINFEANKLKCINMFAKEVYIQRRNALKSKLQASKGILLFLGNSEAAVNYPGNQYRFRQDSNFNYFFGLTDPDLAAATAGAGVSGEPAQRGLQPDHGPGHQAVSGGQRPGGRRKFEHRHRVAADRRGRRRPRLHPGRQRGRRDGAAAAAV